MATHERIDITDILPAALERGRVKEKAKRKRRARARRAALRLRWRKQVAR